MGEDRASCARNLTAKFVVVVTALALSVCFGGAAVAACRPDKSLQWPTIYEGTIGKHIVRLAISYGPDRAIGGGYAYVSSASEIPLTGSLSADGTRIEMRENDAGGRPTGAFQGRFADSDPQFANGSRLNCEVIAGEWTAANGGARLPFELTMSSIAVGTTLGRLYAVAGAGDDETVNLAAARFRKAVLANDRDAVARAVRFPIWATVKGKRARLRRPQDLLANYDAIFTPALRRKIENSVPRLMFARDLGVMLTEHGEIWLDDKGRVLALRN